MLKNTHSRYGTVAIFLHWLTAAAIISLLAVGFIMINVSNRSTFLTLIKFHKSAGLTVFIIMVLRVCWRLYNVVPNLPTHLKRWQRAGARVTHYFLYVISFAMILAGWSMSSFGGHPSYLWGLVDVSLPVARNVPIAQFAQSAHLVIAWIIIATLVLHTSAALWHHYIAKDNTLRKMLGT